MYVSIDRENLRFLHRHPDFLVVSDLVHIEAPHVYVLITPFRTGAELKGWTDMELKMLYRHTTGMELAPNHSRKDVQALLAEVVDRLPVTDVNKFELDRQAAYLGEENETPYKYVKGATRPGLPAELFPLTAKAPADVGAAIAAQRPAQAATSAPASVTPAKVAKAPQRAPAAPRSGGVRGTIWEVADAMWEKEGKPTARAEVLALRRRMMDVLETDYDVKRSSASNELGQWQKARLA